MLEILEIKEKVGSLEALLGEFLVSTGRSINSLSREMKEFKNEMKADREESRKEMTEFKNEMKELQYNTKIENEKRFARWDKEHEKEIENRKIEREKDKVEYLERQTKDKEEYLERQKKDKLEFKKEIQAHNKQWGNLANSLGRIVEDITAPSVREVIQAVFNDTIIDFSTNRTKKLKELNLKGEYDIIAISNTTVYLIEVKTASREQYLDSFLRNIEKFKKLFPEYADKKLIPIFAGLNFNQDFIDKATKRKLYIMAFKEWEYMDILNAKELV